jgi:hypothetical protein
MTEYPLKKFDHLNRMVYVDWNGVERCVNVYWGDTNKIKIKYRLWHNDSEVEAYDKNGNIIIRSSAGLLSLRMPRLVYENGKMAYVVDKKKIEEWRQKLVSKNYKH